MKPFNWLAAIALGGFIAHFAQSARSETSPIQSSQVTTYALALIGLPYRYGGTVPETGFDCSGFVGHVMHVTKGTKLPRSSYEMASTGQAIQRTALKPGDLVFHNTLGRPNSHVGIYLGNGQFIHSPKTGDVVQRADLNSHYWRARFNGARRIGEIQRLALAEEVELAAAQ